jgi:hypothetical protein
VQEIFVKPVLKQRSTDTLNMLASPDMRIQTAKLITYERAVGQAQWENE